MFSANKRCCCYNNLLHQVVKLAQQLHERTPDYAKLGASSLTPLPPPAAAGVSGVSSSGVSGSYPVFKEYPTGSVETQAQERQRIQEAEEALIRRRQVGRVTAGVAASAWWYVAYL